MKSKIIIFMYVCMYQVLVYIFFNFGNNYRFTDSCKERYGRSPVPFIQLPPMLTSYITIVQYQNQHVNHRAYSDFASYTCIYCVCLCSSMQFLSHVQLLIITTKIKRLICTTRFSCVTLDYYILKGPEGSSTLTYLYWNGE